MVFDGDDQRTEGSRGEKRALDLLAMFRSAAKGDYQRTEGSPGEKRTLNLLARFLPAANGDDQRTEDSPPGEKRTLDLLARFLPAANGDEEIRDRGGNQEQESNMFKTRDFLGKKRKSQHDYASSLVPVESKRRHVIKPPVRERTQPVKRRPVIREPVMAGAPEWVVDLMIEKNGADLKLVIEKKIKATDVNKDQSRLSMPFHQMWELDFLNEAELNIVEDHLSLKKKGVDVILVDSDDIQWGVSLKRWDTRTSFSYALCSYGWKQVARRNKLKIGQTIRIWSFHSQDQNLYFAFLPLPPPAAQAVAPTRDSGNLVLEGLDLNRPLAQECTEMAVTESMTLDLELRLSMTETMTLDLELRL